MARETELSDVARTLSVMEPVPTKHTRGKRICFTGHLGLPRNQYQEIIEQAGMVFEKRVAWGLNYLCTNSDWTKGSIKGSASKKFEQAQRFNVRIINEEQLLELLSKTDDD
jgi:NAD-dependent DNA ligase